MKLRDYQQAAVDSIYEWLEANEGNPLVVVPTGGGKSVIIAEWIRATLVQWPAMRFLCVTHVKELVEQNYNQFVRLWPQAPAGIYSASVGRKETHAAVTFCSVQSVFRTPAMFGEINVLLVDEAHLIPSKGFGMYRQLIDSLKRRNERLRVVGFTATPFRTDSGQLDAGDDRLFHGAAYEVEIVDLIEQGYLCRVTNQGTKAEIDTTEVHTRGGDFVESELGAAAMAGDLVARTADELVARGEGRRSWLLFCSTIAHAEAVQQALIERGIDCDVVFGSTRKAERERVVEDFRAGRVRAVANVGVLTTGFDAPNVDLIAMLRPTKSPGLYVQMVGRGLRLCDGKDDCLVLDFGGNVMRHGPIDCIKVRQPKPAQSGLFDGYAKKCPTCARVVGPTAKVCPGCGFEWIEEERTPDHDTVPDEASLLIRGRSRFERWEVSRVLYLEHQKPGKPPSLRVLYQCGYKREASEFVCFEHDGFAKRKAAAWWLQHGGKKPVPETVDLARVRISLDELAVPFRLVVDNTGTYPVIKNVRMENTEESLGGDDLEPAPPVAPITDYNDIPF